MRRLPLALLVAALAAPAASGQPAGQDSVARRPAFEVPLTGDFAPPQTSAVRAYLYSVAATAIPIAAGVLLLRASDPSETPGGFSPGDAGIVLVYAGAWFGPNAGNLSLGAGADARRSFMVAGGGFLAGVVLAGAGVGVAGVCVLDDLSRGRLGDDDCLAGPVATGLIVMGAAVAVVGTVAGTGYALATVPANAARARRYRQAYPDVTVAPGWRAGRPALSVRVGL